MAGEPTRTLAIIVSIDAAGYSSAAEHDDERAVNVVTELRAKVAEIAARHRGRIFNTAGDGIMVEFASADGALRAVLEMLADSTVNAARTRIGMHVGDIRRMPDGDLMGHGVNVAARLQALASPGTAVASAALIDLVRGQITSGLTSLGRVRLDKMDEALEVFVLSLSDDLAPKPSPAFRRAAARTRPAWLWPAVAAAAVAVAVVAIAVWPFTSPSAKAPQAVASVIGPHSIAVLPFENLSADKDNAFFASGIQDEILTRLTKIGSLKVISRTSTAHLASRPDNLPDIARQLGVAYILEGSVQRSGDTVRINVQLINAATDNHAWAEIYDRKLTDIFQIQSEVAIAIASSLNAEVTGSEKRALARAPTSNSAAYDAYLRALTLYGFSSKINRDIDQRIESNLSEAVKLDPGFAVAWALSARHQSFKYLAGDSSDARRAAARNALENAVRLAPDLEEVLLWQRRTFSIALNRTMKARGTVSKA